ncbi:C-3',4' desaturase CrtD [Leptothoe spongobia]|uniref:C-3',4' desaturase CrtD n=1 Tax=Leptothoe spongobia TAU-MAC 1115 TaxID=1967444 RepID=A0A947DK52_9CYAN|nr:C-3',4' desaturase CrtD [Leptothoe spongobia]MBT9317549.1 C-3',4' desaturase CrtD [Leptothoe spongobia TAU-MAC 1115]
MAPSIGSQPAHRQPKVIVIGAGIGGLTAAALLAKRGYSIEVYEQAMVTGGCASTFRRRGFTFDVGATQVAGLEPGGIHHQIFSDLGLDLPAAEHCDPACAVFLPDETTPINVWRDPNQWQIERQRQFPGSEPFWQKLGDLFNYSWQFQTRQPVLPPRSLWDTWQLTNSLRPNTLLTVPYTFSTVGQLLKGYGLYENQRLKTFLDLQLKLYSQVGADETALLYAATTLGVSQAPQGLFHLQGSMQVLSDALVKAIKQYGGQVFLGHSVKQIQLEGNRPRFVRVCHQKTGETWLAPTDHVVANVTVQNLTTLLGKQTPKRYQQRVDKLLSPSGAFVVYLGVEQAAIPKNCPPHLQFLYDYDGPIGENNSLFVSVSRPGDGRAPEGKATIVASSFTDVQAWQQCRDYDALKAEYEQGAIAKLNQYFNLAPQHIIHAESGTPRTFERYTARHQGMVGGIGQRLSTFGPFGFATRTPIPKIWLVGDCVHPGEGTAGVSYAALTAVRQIEQMER